MPRILDFLRRNGHVFHANFLAVVDRRRAAQGEEQHRGDTGLRLPAEARRQARAVVISQNVVGPREIGQRGLHCIHDGAHLLRIPRHAVHQEEVEGQVQFVAIRAIVLHPAIQRPPQLADAAAVIVLVQHAANLAENRVHVVLIHVVDLQQALKRSLAGDLRAHWDGRLSRRGFILDNQPMTSMRSHPRRAHPEARACRNIAAGPPGCAVEFGWLLAELVHVVLAGLRVVGPRGTAKKCPVLGRPPGRRSRQMYQSRLDCRAAAALGEPRCWSDVGWAPSVMILRPRVCAPPPAGRRRQVAEERIDVAVVGQRHMPKSAIGDGRKGPEPEHVMPRASGNRAFR